MQQQKHNLVLRNILLSKYNANAYSNLVHLAQMQLRVISELKQDVIINSLFTMSLVPNQLLLNVASLKKVQLQTSVALKRTQSMSLFYSQLPLLFKQSVDKVLATGFSSHANKLVFTFKGLDFVSGPLRQL